MGRTFKIDEKEIGNQAVISALHAIDEHQVETRVEIEAVNTKLDKVLKAFPAGDIDGHRQYHDLMIEKNRALRQLSAAVKEKTLLWLICGFIVYVGIAIAHEVKHFFGG